MEFRSIPKPVASDDIELVSAEKFIQEFDNFSSIEDSAKRLPSIRKTGEAAQFLFNAEQCASFVPRLITIINNESVVTIKVIAIEQLIRFIENMHNSNISAFNDVYPTMKTLIMDETEEISIAAKNVLKKLGEYADDNDVTDYLNFVDELLKSSDGFISSAGLELIVYFAAKSKPENVKKHIFDRLKQMSEDIQFSERKGAVSIIPAILSNIDESDLPEILSIYERLSNDAVFSIRKACAHILTTCLTAFPDKETVVSYAEKFSKDKSRFVAFEIITHFGELAKFLGKTHTTTPLLEFFVANSQTPSDSEQQYFASYHLSAVLSTMGMDSWPILKNAFSSLSLSIHWRNRKCIASSLHDIAAVVGQEETLKSRNFNEKIVKFIPILGEEKSVTIITLLQNAVQSPDWRIRKAVSKQLGDLALATPMYAQYVEEIAHALLLDAVADVRHAAAKECGKVVTAFLNAGYVGVSAMIQKLNEMAKSERKTTRIDYSAIAAALANELPPDQFVPHILPSLLEVAHDKVDEVRIAVATNIKMKIEQSKNYNEEMKKIVEELEKDSCAEVVEIIKNGPLNLFKRKVVAKEIVVDPAKIVTSFEGFGKR
ncbi:serine/threonine protein phosphatase 2A 65 kDa regulatory subunit A beta isoform [Entamoeba marina]